MKHKPIADDRMDEIPTLGNLMIWTPSTLHRRRMCPLYGTESKWKTHPQRQFEAKQGSVSLCWSGIKQVVMQPFGASSDLMVDSNSGSQKALLNNRNYPVGAYCRSNRLTQPSR